jgi:glutamate racemase
VLAAAAPLLVPLVEEGWLEGDVPRLAVERYVEPLVRAGARVLVLGCTHYPLLAPIIASVATELAAEPVTIVDSAVATAEDVAAWIADERIVRAPNDSARSPLEILVTDRPASFQTVAARFLGADAPDVTQIDLASLTGP